MAGGTKQRARERTTWGVAAVLYLGPAAVYHYYSVVKLWLTGSLLVFQLKVGNEPSLMVASLARSLRTVQA